MLIFTLYSLLHIIVNVDFNSCINNWCYQHGTMGQYTRCKTVSNNGRTCHDPEIRFGSAIGGKPGGIGDTIYYKHATDWCRQLFPTTGIMRGTVKYMVSYLVFLLLKL